MKILIKAAAGFIRFDALKILEKLTKYLVSMIIPTYNFNNILRETLDCVIAQSYKSWDLIITDDGSTVVTPFNFRRIFKN